MTEAEERNHRRLPPPDVLARFHKRYPGVEPRVEIANNGEIQDRLLDGVLDIGLTEGFAEHPELEADVFDEDRMVVIVPPGHSLLGEPSVAAARLSREPFIVREEGSGTRAVVERAFAAMGLTLSPVMSLGSIEAVKRAVAADAGVAMVSGLTVGLETGRWRSCRSRTSPSAVRYIDYICAASTRAAPSRHSRRNWASDRSRAFCRGTGSWFN